MIGCRMPLAAMAVLALALASLPPGPARASDRCAAPAEFTTASGALPNAAAAVRQRRVLRVLIVGTGSSTHGGTTAQEASYPQRLAEELRAAFPGVAVTVQTRGGRGLTAGDLLPIVSEGLEAFRPDILIWQSGTVDAVRGLDPDGYGQVIAEGVERALKRGTDVILMDMQFSRFSRAAVNYGPYRHALDSTAAANAGVLAFQRYELMRYWAATGQIDVERAPRREWSALTDILHACLARALAEVIRDGVRQAGR
jgi:hypothetical protein